MIAANRDIASSGQQVDKLCGLELSRESAGPFPRKQSSCSMPSGTSEDVKSRAEASVSELAGPKIREVAAKMGWADDDYFNRVAEAHRDWSQHPDAFVTWLDCEVVGWKSRQD